MNVGKGWSGRGRYLLDRIQKSPIKPPSGKSPFGLTIAIAVSVLLLATSGSLTPLPAAAAPTPGEALQTGVTATQGPASDGTTTGWTSDGSTSCSGTCYSLVNDYPDKTANQVESPQLTACTGAGASSTITLKLPSAPTGMTTMTGVKVNFGTKYTKTGSGTITSVKAVFQMFQSNGTTALTSAAAGATISTSAATSNKALTITGATGKSAWDNATLSTTVTGICTGTITSLLAFLYSLQVQYTYTGVVGTTQGTLSQNGYIWENDDGTSADTDTAQAPGNTAITGVQKGERMTLRVQDAAATAAVSGNLGLFYDRNDGYFTKVRTGATPVIGAGSCADTNFLCTTADSAGTTAGETSVATDNNGHAWVSYYDSTNKHLKLATYVGTGGSGCGTSTAWTCITLTNGSGNGEGRFSSIAVDHAGVLWISYWDAQNSRLMVAKSVAGSGCAVSTWTCNTIQTSVTMDTANGDATSMTIDGSGTPWLAFHNLSSNSVYVLQYTNGSTDCSTQWTGCTTAISTAAAGFPSMVVDGTLTPWVTFYDGSGNLQAAKYVTSGGTCNNTAYSCYQIDTGTVGKYASMSIAPDDNPWISYYDGTNHKLKVTQYLGGATGGSGCGGTDSTHWTCTSVDATTADIGKYSSIGFDPAGHAWVTYQDTTNGYLRLARNISGSGCTSASWSCTSIDTSTTPGTGTSLAFAPDGTAYLTSVGTGSSVLRVATLNRAGEITPAAGIAATNGASTTQSHSDMTSVGDTTDQSSANCISGTWVAGKWVDTEEESGLSLASGKCTEVAFVISTTQALVNTTYRFVMASNDGWRWDKSVFRGPLTISQYPQMTLSTNTTARFAKDTTWDPANCTDTTWGCAGVVSTTSAMDISTAFDPTGVPWFSYRNDSTGDVYAAHYVGGTAGGTTCGASGSSAWSCTMIDDSSTLGGVGSNGVADEATSLVFDKSGTPWISYMDIATNSGVRLAHYVGGSSGTGCVNSTAWTCVTINSTAGVGNWAHLAVDDSGSLWLTFVDANNGYIYVAHQTGTTGSGCTGTTDPTWTCTLLVGSEDQGVSWVNMAIDSSGAPWLAYYTDEGTTTGYGLHVARYVGQGGTGCTTGITQWTCQNVDVIAASGCTGCHDPGAYPNIAFDGSDNAWLAFLNGNGSSAFTGPMAAKYVGTGGTGCSTGVTAWSCWNIDSAGSTSTVGLAMDSTGTPWFSYQGSTAKALVVAHYVGGSSGNCTSSTAFTCTTVDSSGSNTLGLESSLAFDKSGAPWVAYYDTTGAKIKVAKLHRSSAPLSYATVVSNTNSGVSGDGRFHLDSGASPRGTCAGTTNYRGYCALTTADSSYDSITSLANEQPIDTYAEQSASNGSFPSYQWTGKSSVAPSSSTVTLEIYRFGTTNAWVSLATNSAASAGSSFTLTGTASAGSASEYWQSDGSNYWTYYRVYQASSASAPVLSTDQFVSAVTNQNPNTPTALAQYQSNGTTGIPATTIYSYDSSIGSSADSNGGTLSISSTTKRTGVGSLKDVSSAASMWINDGISTTRDLSSGGATFSTWVYVPSADSGTNWFAYLSIYDGTSVYHNGTSVTIPRDTWTLVTFTPGKSVLQSMKYIVVAIGGSGGGTNTAYVDDMQQGNSIWNNSTSVVMSASVSDLDSTDTDYLCVEVKPIATPFTNTETSCGSSVSYSGSPITASVSFTLTDGTQYHWQARTKDAGGLYSSWQSYGGNSDGSPADPDLGIDTTAPTAGSVYDGTNAGVESSYNAGSLSTLSANWASFSDATSGIVSYDYSIGTSTGATDVVGWTNTLGMSASASGLTLRTSQRYYFNVRAIDLAGNVSSVVSSTGQEVAPTLTVVISASSITFANLNSLNSYTDSKNVTITTSTNGYSGYSVSMYATGAMASGANTIAAYSGTWSSPTTWSGTGFGYTSNDVNVSGSNRFSGAAKYAGVPVGSGSAQVVADHTPAVDGNVTGSPISGEAFTVTYKLASSATQPAGIYGTSIIFAVTAVY